MSQLLADRRLLITGAARGIGLAVAKAAIAAGATVAMADIDQAECAVQAAKAGGVAIAMDVSDMGSVATGIAHAVARLGGIDGLVNNAAMLDSSHSASLTEQFERVVSVNLTSILRVSQACLPYLAKGPGAIVNTLSTQAQFGQASSAAYATAKGGGLALTRAMAIDLSPVRVNAVAPGFIDTRMAIQADGVHEHSTDWFRSVYLERRKIPLGRPGTPDDCAGAFVFLLSDMASYITGHCLTVDGGLTATY